MARELWMRALLETVKRSPLAASCDAACTNWHAARLGGRARWWEAPPWAQTQAAGRAAERVFSRGPLALAALSAHPSPRAARTHARHSYARTQPVVLPARPLRNRGVCLHAC